VSAARDAVRVSELLPLSARSFARLSAYAREHLGIELGPSKLSMVQGRLQRRARLLGLGSVDEYCRLLLDAGAGDAERAAFFDEITTNKTDFFREPAHFEQLAKLAAEHEARQPFRVWCAGCSSGEEPYTVAMVLGAHARARPGFEFNVLATDISRRVLHAAHRGIFSERCLDRIPADYRKRFLRRGTRSQEGYFRVAAELRARVRFARLNLMDEDYGVRDAVDAIFFRNVMIYFSRPTQERVVNRLCRHLRSEGRLFIGHAESLAGLAVPLHLISPAVLVKARMP
jgi:chemotaxis protein methyltransferase CheR